MENQNRLTVLYETGCLPKEELLTMLEDFDETDRAYAASLADTLRRKYYGNAVYVRGLIEFTNYCRNDCFYCGIRKSNHQVERYRLTLEEILECCEAGYELGFRTFVLQGGEDAGFSAVKIAEIVGAIKAEYADCAVTLSFGEHSYDAYKLWREAGADRYLLRHETANEIHYGKLHPLWMKSEHRKQCLYQLKELGYQVGSGFMVGSPRQTKENLVEDLLFLKELDPDMIGIGPFLPHKETPFGKEPAGNLELTLFLVSILRLLFPKALIPATTALGTLQDGGRELGILAGANVVMPNLSPKHTRDKYSLYDHKLNTGAESGQGVNVLKNNMKSIGYEIVTARGDRYDF